MRKTLILAAVALTLTAGGALAQQPLKIGFLMPTRTLLGKQAVQAARVAVDMVNANGGVLGGRKVEMIVYDDNYSGAEAAAATQRLLEQDGAKYIGGNFSSTVALAMIPLIQGEGGLYMAAMPKSIDVSKTGYDGVFMLNTTAPEDQAALEKLFDRVKPKTIAYIGENTDFGRQFLKTLQDLGGKVGAKVVYSDFYDTKQSDFNSLVTLAKNSNADTLITMGGVVEQYANVVRSAYEMGYRPRNVIFGPGIMNQNTVKLAGPAAEGSLSVDIYLPSFDNPLNKKFVAAYSEKYGMKPEKTEELSFELIWLIASAVNKAGTDAVPAVIKTLRANTWETPRGTVRFTATGRVEASATIIGIRNGVIAAE